MAMSITRAPLLSSLAEESTSIKPLRRSQSTTDLYKANIRRSVSDPHLCCYANRICATSARPKSKSSPSFGTRSFQFPGSVVPKPTKLSFHDSVKSRGVDVVEHEDTEEIEDMGDGDQEKKVNWIQRVLEIRSQWLNRREKEITKDDIIHDGGDEGTCEASYEEEDEGEELKGTVSYDTREAFSGLLTRVGLSDTKHLTGLAFLCNLAYRIPEIKAKELRRYHHIRFVTSSLEKKAEAMKTLLEQELLSLPNKATFEPNLPEYQKQCLKRPSVSHHIAASAASYVQSRATGSLAIGSAPKEGQDEDSKCISNMSRKQEDASSSGMQDPEVAAYMAATTMTAVVAAGEKEKQLAANDLQSLHSSPCDWFICDDYSTYTRCFVIQGSDSFTSWQANLFFEPIKFEDSGALVHRGIYEAAKGTLKQFMPYISDHISRFGYRAKFQFTGHSLGGSLSLLVQLMLVGRKLVDPSTLRPVVTFGSPFVFCGGQKLLEELGLDESNVHCVMMHRDIVPRAFSCDYPDRVAQLLKRVNGTFKSLPCLSKNKQLYAPLGKMFILQPDETTSPPHPLLPPGSGLYFMDKTKCKSMSSSLRTFMNSPHPLQTLSRPTAYKPGGTILRDHDSGNYLKAITNILFQHTKLQKELVQKAAVDHEDIRWPLLIPPSSHSWNDEGSLEKKATIMRKRITTGA